MHSRMLWVGVVVALVAMSLPATVLGQAQAGTLNGKVVDPDGLALPGVAITLTEQGAGYTRTAVTQGDGEYLFVNLRPGTYDVNVLMQGFKTINQTGLILESGAELTINYNMELATIEEVVTVTAETPLVEVTNNRIGGTLSTKEMDETPANFRNFTALTQLVPGMTPSQSQSTFEGGGATANGAVGATNLFMLDGGYNNDDRLGSGPGAQVRVVLDIISEYQVLASQYSAEYSGAAGAVINMVTKSGTNDFSGRAYTYYRNDSLYARSEFLAPDQPKPDERTLQAGFGIGGPIVRDKAHFYWNYERDEEDLGGFKKFPIEGFPIAQDQIGYFTVRANNYFGRGDVQINPSNLFSARWVLETAPSTGEGFNVNTQVEDAAAYESDYDTSLGLNLTSIMGDRASNSFRFTRIKEDLGTGAKDFFASATDVRFVGYPNNDQFALGQSNSHPGYTAGPGGTGVRTIIHTYLFDDSFSYFLPDHAGDHNLKFGGGFSLNHIASRLTTDSGTYEFESDFPYNPADRSTYPVQFEIALNPPNTPGFDLAYDDWRANFFVQDKWRYNDQLTLNLGLRWDFQHAIPNGGDDFAPRLGFAYDPSGDGKTVIRGGFGRFSLWSRVAINVDLKQRQLVTQNPTATVANAASSVLNPELVTDSQGRSGIAKLSGEGQAALEALRTELLAGNSYSNEPRFDDPNRSMPYQWGWSLGVQHELAPEWALTVDYVANATRDQNGLIDINEPVDFVRPGPDGFDPNGELVPFELGGARDTNFRRVLQYQTPDALNGDYKSLQVGIRKRFTNRYSLRAAYTLQKANRVGSGTEARVWDDNDPRTDYGRAAGDRRNVLTLGGNFNPIGGLDIGALLSAQSGAPVNETTGQDGNGDNDRTDRPIQGVDDADRPILSEIGALNAAVPYGLDGPGFLGLDISIRYNFSLGGTRTLGLFWDTFNLFNRTNYNDPTGNRSSGNFLVYTSANFPRQMQLGARFMF